MRTPAYTDIAAAAVIFIAVGCGSDDPDPLGPPTSSPGGTGTMFAQAGAGGSEASPAQGGSGGVSSNAGSGSGGSSAVGGTGGASATGGSDAANGGTGGAANEPEPVEPQCEAFDVVNSGAGERTNAALCFGLPDSPFCQTHPTAPYSRCETEVYWYEVEWYDVDGVTYGNLYGNNFPETGGPLVAIVYQAEDGSFRYADPNTEVELMFCTVVGDVANRCVWP